MVSRSTLIRTARLVGICLVVSFVVLNVFLRVEAYRFRRQAERLMSDIQALKLRQSNWLEAERLISRWGKYGDYEGHCDASFCRYSIVLKSAAMALGNSGVWRHLDNRFVRLVAPLIFDYSGGRLAYLLTTFVVQDSVVLRKNAVFTYEVPPTFSDSSGYALIATSRATSRLTSGGWPLIGSEQLAEHPFYAFRRPGGCSSCLMVNVTFTPDTPDPEMRRLTTFNLNCITRLRACRNLEDIYPAAENWHLYDYTPGAPPLTTQPDPHRECATPPCLRYTALCPRSRSRPDSERYCTE
jgi:hypothetical protein